MKLSLHDYFTRSLQLVWSARGKALRLVTASPRKLTPVGMLFVPLLLLLLVSTANAAYENKNEPPKGAPVVVVMDTTAPGGIYDADNIAIGASNTKELIKILQEPPLRLPSGSLHAEPLYAGWDRETGVISLRPDLVIIHRSSFFHSYNAEFKFGSTNEFKHSADDPKWRFLYDRIGDDKLVSLLGSIGDEVPRTKFLVYSRGTDTNWLRDDFRAEWVRKVEARFPKLNGRISTMVIPRGYNGSFRQEETRELLRSNVIEILMLPKKRELIAGNSSRLQADENAADANKIGARRSSSSFLSDYFSDWFARVDRAKEKQPHWPSPLATTVVLLKEALRYDISRQSLRDGHTLYNFGSDKGLEFIPAEDLQLIVGLPAWLSEDTHPAKTGFADQTFLAKYRLASANEKDGNYMISAMLGLAVPNGSSEYTTHHFVFTPTLGLGKGWGGEGVGEFAIQSNIRTSIPENESGRARLGTPIIFNNTTQYHLVDCSWPKFGLWPEFEVNYTYWPNGRRSGMSQMFLTPGLAFYKFHLYSRLEFVVVAGAQFAVTDHPIYHRNFILSLQFPF